MFLSSCRTVLQRTAAIGSALCVATYSLGFPLVKARANNEVPVDTDIRGTIAAKLAEITRLRQLRAKSAIVHHRQISEDGHNEKIKTVVASYKPKVNRMPVVVPKPQVVTMTTVQTFHFVGVASGHQTIPVRTDKGDEAWDKAHLCGKTVKIALRDKDNNPIGADKEYTIAPDRTVTIDLPNEAFEIIGRDDSRTLYKKVSLSKGNPPKPQKPGKRPAKPATPPKPAAPADQATAPSKSAAPGDQASLSVTSRVAAISATLQDSLSSDYEIRSNAVQPMPPITEDRLQHSAPTTSAPHISFVTPGPSDLRSSRYCSPDPPSKTSPRLSTVKHVEQTFSYTYEVATAPVDQVQPIVLQRTVADFALKAPEGVEWKLGNRVIGADAFKEGIYQFQASAIEAASGLTVTGTKLLTGGVQEAILRLPDSPDLYMTNSLEAPALRLTRLEKVEIADDPSAELSAFGKFFSSLDEIDFAGLPDLKKDHKAGRILTPFVGHDKGRFGHWYCYDQKGIYLRIREISEKPAKFTVENVRLVKADAGSLGGIAVGAPRDQVHRALGDPDPGVSSTLDQWAGKFKDLQKREPSLLEKPDESYLENGIRLKYDGDVVKWIELARPTTLLLRGTTAFGHSDSRRLYIGGTDVRAKEYLRDVISRTGVARVVDLAENADYVLTPAMSVTSDIVREPHVKAVQKPDLDKNGNQKTDKKGNLQFVTDYVTTHTDEYLAVTTQCDIKVRNRNAEGVEQTIPGFSGSTVRYSDGPNTPGHTEDSPALAVNQAAVPELEQQLSGFDRKGGRQGAVYKGVFDLCNVQGRVTTIDYETNQLSVNLGARDGIQKGDDVTEMDVFVRTGVLRAYSFVDPDTGKVLVPTAASSGDDPAQWAYVEAQVAPGERPLNLSGLAAGRLQQLGEKVSDWAEVKDVFDDHCIVGLKHKDGSNSTKDDWHAVQRVADPSTGLVIARVRVKIGEAKDKKTGKPGSLLGNLIHE
ncbi:MAG: hypothetical protein JWL77_3331 [Chthonomonadaceae bacterium]|nr:hypothetical protein [Chthonomonadaceae bacterium]